MLENTKFGAGSNENGANSLLKRLPKRFWWNSMRLLTSDVSCADGRLFL